VAAREADVHVGHPEQGLGHRADRFAPARRSR
jgi:hypothetical protein